ncbi:helix-turn-helix transcriptional regulator [Microbacterium sp. ET2]|uniref:helix-turn-helix transcriptional regulator n=1 Tax=Microbacterium albipurpureum TaxID=3050384 RepID=UPI00259CA574|nr:helix-turn-helix transcriptional regulator [Microbacterium sp. ET2 (Ac-2212)]WJL94657.1 helix-turn-helix transcriptional regulator [Microbacterium sp. ET2 (Ac-2212)]
MTPRNAELADFLRRARAAADPVRADLPPDGRVRRVPGLRREEVARLARVSTDYYTRLEQGRPIVPSPAVVDAIARALGLDETGTRHLRDLLDPTIAADRATHAQRARHGLHQLMEGLDATPGMILGRRTDVLAINPMARALIADFEVMPARERNYARWMFLSPEARERLIDWEAQARRVVENLRLEAGRSGGDPDLAAFVTALAVASSDFARWWDEHRVFQRTFGDKRFRHPLVGELTLQYETLTLPGDPDQTLFLYTAARGSRSAEALSLLHQWIEQQTPAAVSQSLAR